MLSNLLNWWNTPEGIGLMLGAGIAFLVADFLSPRNWPAHAAYVCFGLAVLLIVPLRLEASFIAGFMAWASMELLHWQLFSRFLTVSQPSNP
jgi:hypothetical protein